MSTGTRLPVSRLIATRVGVAVTTLTLTAASLAIAGAGPATAMPAEVPVGNAPVLPAQAQVGGAAPASTPLQLTVALQPSDPKGLAALAESVATPGSPNYRHYLAAGEFAQRFGPSPATVQQVTTALSALGLHPGPVSPSRLAIPVTATAGEAASAFGVALRSVQLASGRVAFANTGPPRLPAAVAPAVATVIGLDNLTQRRPLLSSRRSAGPPHLSAGPAASIAPGALRVDRATSLVGATGPQPCAAAIAGRNSHGGYTADQIATAYGLGGLYSAGNVGSGLTVALYELAGYNPVDVAVYKACYGVTGQVSNVVVDGGPRAGDPGSIEVELDTDGIMGIAPAANIVIYGGPNTEAGSYDIFSRMVNDDTAKVISTSWGSCEALTFSALQPENVLFQQAALQGQTIVASAGDNGSADCGVLPDGTQPLAVDDPASQPFVTGVGGTNLTAIGPPPLETVYNESGTGHGVTGGGISAVWPMPAYQHGPGVMNGFSNGARQVPDVAASADPGNGSLVYYTGTEVPGSTGWFPIGGTSIGSPMWAGLVALIDQSCACSVGFLNPALYNVGAGSFHDITVGNNDDVGIHGGLYPATAGYDMATGLGTPNGTALATSLTQTQASFTYPTAGQMNVDTTQAFTWTTVPVAQAYYLVVGTTVYGADLVNSGVLSTSQSSLAVPDLPTGRPLYATLLTEVSGAWTRYQAITFTAAPGKATFTYPFNGQLGIDRTHLFTWNTIPQAQAYDMVIGTTLYGTDLFNTGVLPPSQSSFAVPALPSGKILYATLLTKVNGAWTRYQVVGFTAAPAMATFASPISGQLLVDTTKPFTWTTFPGIQAFYLVVGTTIYGADLINSGLLPASQTSFTPPAKLPPNTLILATLLTEIGGVWTYQLIGFTAAP